MSAFSSIYSSLSGLFGFSRALDNASDNVANINTPGFKGRDLIFRELANEQGGGIGVEVSDGSLRFQQGDINETGNTTDLAIDGEGLFILREGDSVVYSRAGQFQLDEDGYLIDPASGRRVAALESGNQLSDIRIDRTAVSQAVASSLVNFVGNLNSDASQGDSYPGSDDDPLELEIFDRLGESHTLRASFTRGDANNWEVQLSNENGIALGDSFTIGFDEDTGRPLAGQNEIQFSYQPFSILETEGYEDTFDGSSQVNVDGGDLSTSENLIIDRQAGYGILSKVDAESEGVVFNNQTTLRFNAEGTLVTADSGTVAQALSEDGEITDFSLEGMLTDSGAATQRIDFDGNLDASLLAEEELPEGFEVDVVTEDGELSTVQVALVKDQNNAWNVRVTDQSGNRFATDNLVAFDEDGNPTISETTFQFVSIERFSESSISEVIENDGEASLSTAGDLQSADDLSLAVNQDGLDQEAAYLLSTESGESGDYQYSQDLTLTVDEDGFLVDTESGNYLTAMDANGAVSPIDLSEFVSVEGEETTNLQLVGNFDPADPVGTTYPEDPTTDPQTIEVYNNEGTAIELSTRYEKTADNEWTLNLSTLEGETVADPIVFAFDPATGDLASASDNQFHYQPTNNLSTAEVTELLQAPPPVNVTGGDLTTGSAVDLSLEQTDLDNGAYFAERTGEEASYTTSTTVVFDASNRLVNASTGERMAGLDSNGRLQDIDASESLTSDAVATTSIELSGTLDTSDTTTQASTVTVFDADGGTHDLTLELTQAGGEDQWDVQVFDESGTNISNAGTGADITFYSNGNPQIANTTISYDPLVTGDPYNLTLDFSGVIAPPTPNSESFSIQENNDNGRAQGGVEEVVYNDDGSIVFNYDNGYQQTIGQIAVREFDGSAVDIALDPQMTEDAQFGTDINVGSMDGQGAGELTAYSANDSGALTFTYDNNEVVSGPQIAVVDQANTPSTMSVNFSAATSVAGENTNLNVSNVDGLEEGQLETLEFNAEGVLEVTYTNGEEADGPRLALAEEAGNRIDDLIINFGAADSSEGTTSRGTGSSNLTVSEVNGRSAGNIISTEFDEDGYLVVEYSNGEVDKNQRIALAAFNDQNAIEPTSGSFFQASDTSGRVLGYANEGSFGAIRAASLELSNVDLTSEFGNIIIIQRGYQASSQALNATNEVIEELYNTVKGG